MLSEKCQLLYLSQLSVLSIRTTMHLIQHVMFPSLEGSRVFLNCDYGCLEGSCDIVSCQSQQRNVYIASYVVALVTYSIQTKETRYRLVNLGPVSQRVTIDLTVEFNGRIPQKSNFRLILGPWKSNNDRFMSSVILLLVNNKRDGVMVVVALVYLCNQLPFLV